jgi:SAM-dependent methyltransferase
MTSAGVDAYYDANTARFLVVGGTGAALAIHRPLWADGITDVAQAAAHINQIIADCAVTHLGAPPARVWDLGCGVGGSLFHLGAIWPHARLDGITISKAQMQRGMAEAAARDLTDRCQIHQGDFTAPPPAGRDAAPLAIAIESHVHAASALAFLQGAARYVVPDGLLIVVDDMLARPLAALPRKDQRLVAAFRQGWRLGHVPDVAGFSAMAGEAGFTPVAALDLTAMIQLNRWRDRALHLAGPAAQALGLNRYPVFGNMIGGNALTRAYQRGAMQYRCMVLRRN